MTNDTQAELILRTLRDESRDAIYELIALAVEDEDLDTVRRARTALGHGVEKPTTQPCLQCLEAMTFVLAAIAGGQPTSAAWTEWDRRVEHAFRGLKLLLGYDPRDADAALRAEEANRG